MPEELGEVKREFGLLEFGLRRKLVCGFRFRRVVYRRDIISSYTNGKALCREYVISPEENRLKPLWFGMGSPCFSSLLI